jgi:hypothetical protein
MVAAAHRDRISVRSPGVARALLVALMVLALIAQGYVAQTHIHEQSRFTSNVGLTDGGAPQRDNQPTKNDPINCPACQQMAHAGQFVVPAWLTPFLVLVSVSSVAIRFAALPYYDPISHHWLGRGPPPVTDL